MFRILSAIVICVLLGVFFIFGSLELQWAKSPLGDSQLSVAFVFRMPRPLVGGEILDNPELTLGDKLFYSAERVVSSVYFESGKYLRGLDRVEPVFQYEFQGVVDKLYRESLEQSGSSEELAGVVVDKRISQNALPVPNRRVVD